MLKLSIALGRGLKDPLSTVQQMNQAQVCRPWHTSECMQVDGGCIGFVKTCADFSAVPCVLNGVNGNRLLLAGSPMLLGGGLKTLVTNLVDNDLDAACRELTRLDGHFVAVFWEACSQRLAVVTDFLGLQPLHMVHNEGKLLLSTDLKGIAQSEQYELAPDHAGWGCFVGFGQALGRITQAKGVEHVLGATELTYDVAQDWIAKRRYWTWPSGKHGMRLSDVNVDRVVDSVAESLRGDMELNPSPTSLLSGGTDSRLIMAILRTVQDSPNVLSVMKPGHFGGADGHCTPSRPSHVFRASHGSALAPRSLPDGQFPSISGHAGDRQPRFEPVYPEGLLALHRDLEAVWDGCLGGYFLKATTHPPGGFGPYLAEQAVSKDSRAWECAKVVFAPSVVDEMFQGFTDTLHQEVSALPDDEFGVNRFVMGNRVTRRTVVHSTQVYTNTVLPLIAGSPDQSLNTGWPSLTRFVRISNSTSASSVTSSVSSAGSRTVTNTAYSHSVALLTSLAEERDGTWLVLLGSYQGDEARREFLHSKAIQSRPNRRAMLNPPKYFAS